MSLLTGEKMTDVEKIALLTKALKRTVAALRKIKRNTNEFAEEMDIATAAIKAASKTLAQIRDGQG